MSDRNAAGDKLLRAIQQMQLPSHSKLVVAVSGGSDSVALLWSLRLTRAGGADGPNLVVAHINHQLRGDESDGDEQFVRSLAQQWELPTLVHRVDTAAYARDHRLSMETAAREVRYAALEEMRVASGATAVVTAHTMDDQAETVIMHLARGAGIDGLSGMRRENASLLRPFLEIRHQTVLAALAETGLSHRVDSSNASRVHRRNRLRIDVMPALEAWSAGASRNIARTAGLVRDDADFIKNEARRLDPYLNVQRGESWVSIDEHVWRALHPSLQTHVLRTVLREVADVPDIPGAVHLRRLMHRLRADEDGSIHAQLPGSLKVRVLAGRIYFSRGEGERVRDELTVELPVPGSVPLPDRGLRLTASIVHADADLPALIAVSGASHALCDAASLGNVLQVRFRRPGDRVRPLGGHGTRKVQDVLVDRKIPVESRDDVPIVTNEDHIVWVAGIVQDDRTKVTSATNAVIHLAVRPWTPKPP